MKELFASAVAIFKFWITVIIIQKIVEKEYIIESVIPIFLAAFYGLAYYRLFTINLNRRAYFFMCTLIGIGVFFYAFPFRYLSIVYLGVEACSIVLFIRNPDIIPDMNNDEYKESSLKNDVMELHSQGLKQSEIAKYFGKTQGYISKIINDKNKR